MNGVIYLCATVFLFAAINASARAQGSAGTSDPATTQQTSPGNEEAQELAKKLSNPVSSLISVPFQSNFDFGMGNGSGWRYAMNFQPVIPVALNSRWNLISRTILPIIHQHNVAGTDSQSGLGDVTQSFFFSPREPRKFIWGAGPALLIPTATDDLLGTYDWSGNDWSIPVHFTVSRLVRFGRHPVSFGGALRCWATSPAGGPENCGFRFIVTPLFPRG